MLCLKIVSVLAVILCLMPEQSQGTGIFAFGSHHYFTKCPNTINTTYTSDTKFCYIFRNPCYARQDMKERLRTNKPRLYLVDKASCKVQCKRNCGVKKSPVCGEYEGSLTTFANNCELWKTACIKGQSILKVRDGACSTRG